MKNNYPIKYALIPMIEQVGWANGLHDLVKEYEVRHKDKRYEKIN